MMLVEKMNDSVLVAPTVGILTPLKQRNFGNMKPSRTETREREIEKKNIFHGQTTEKFSANSSNQSHASTRDLFTIFGVRRAVMF